MAEETMYIINVKEVEGIGYYDFNNFYELEKAEINRLRNTHTLDWYTA